MSKTFYYPVYSDGRIGERFDSLDKAQASVVDSGVPHHVECFLAQRFTENAGYLESPQASYCPNWYKHWRLLELAKKGNRP